MRVLKHTIYFGFIKQENWLLFLQFISERCSNFAITITTVLCIARWFARGKVYQPFVDAIVRALTGTPSFFQVHHFSQVAAAFLGVDPPIAAYGIVRCGKGPVCTNNVFHPRRHCCERVVAHI